jgi:GWxTD domain-containing protein
MSKIAEVRIDIGWTVAACVAVLIAGALLAPADAGARSAPGNDGVAPQRTSFLGPEEGESLSAWTARWLDGPVQYIATDEEKEIYARLENTTQRLQFIRLFWERRDPTYRGPDNEFVDEFVRRVEYANEEFSDGGPGWKTVFGRVVLVLGPPARTERQLGFPASVSQRPVILWSYDERLPEWPTSEMLMFVFQRGRWRLAPPSNFNEPAGVTAAQRDLERFNMLAEIPNDFARTTEAMIRGSLAQTVNYNDVINSVRADVVFPDADIPFAWAAEFGGRSGDNVTIDLKLTWRMESLIFHAVEQDFETEMVVYAVLFGPDGEPVDETSKHLNFVVPASELQARGDALIEETLTLSAPPGTYQLTLSLDDHLLGYRSVYKDELVVPSR